MAKPLTNYATRLYIDMRSVGTPLPATATAHVKVTDLRPYISATAENDYTIRIHNLLENSAETAARVFDHNQKYPWTDVINGNAPTSVLMVVQQPRTWSLMGQSFNNVVGSILAGVCGSGLVALAPGVSPEAAVLADMVFNVVGWTVQNSGDPEPTLTKPISGDFSAFTTAIGEQKIINTSSNAPNINDLVDCPDDWRISCPDGFAAVAANPQKYWNYGVPKGQCHSGVRYIKCTVTSDAYGTNGYTGQQTNYPVIDDRYLSNVWQWTVQSTVGIK